MLKVVNSVKTINWAKESPKFWEWFMKDCEPEFMTLEEIEKELGYKIIIVDKNKKENII